MATGPAPKQVNDWQTVEANDWQDVPSGDATTSTKAQPGTFDPHPGENAAKAFLRGGVGAAVNFVKNFPESLEQPSLAATPPPVIYGAPKASAAATDAYNQGVVEQGQGIRDQVQQAKDNPAYTAGGIILPALAVEGVSRGARALAPKLRPAAQGLVGAGEKAVKATVAKEAGAAQSAAKSTEESNRASLSAHNNELREAGRKNVNAHVDWLKSKAEVDKANALAQKAVEEHNRATSSQYEQSLDEAGRKNLNAHIKHLSEKADTAKANVDAARAVEEHNRAEMAKHRSAVDEASKKNNAAHAKYLSDKAEADNANAAARSIPDARVGLEDDIHKNSRDLQAEIETSRKNALEIGNDKFNTVNEELNPLPADMEAVHGLFHEAAESFGETQDMPALVKRFGKSLERGDGLTYRDLQPMYSELGKELSKGTLPGTTYHAYDLMHDKIGEEMQRIADSQGMGKQLTGARAYWKRMKQAFGKPYNPNDAGNQFLEKTSPEYARASETENQGRMLGSFNETIPQVAERIKSARTRLSSLPSEATRPIAKAPEYPDEVTVNPPSLKPAPKPQAGPEYPNEAKVDPPKYKGPAERKAYPEYPEEVTVSAPKTNPIEIPDVNTRAIREQLLDRWSAGESQLSKFQVRSLVGGGLGAVLGGLFDGKIGAGAGGVLGSTLGPAAISRLVEIPAVREWLTRPPAGELESLRKLPSADRLRITDTLKRVVDQSSKFGKPIRVAPAVTAIIMGSQGLAPRRPAQNATDAWQGIEQ